MVGGYAGAALGAAAAAAEDMTAALALAAALLAGEDTTGALAAAAYSCTSLSYSSR